jgi:DNA-binding CsgD family transcriptional regulator
VSRTRASNPTGGHADNAAPKVRREDDVERARVLLASGIAGGDTSEQGISRFADVSISDARAALNLCREAGLIDGNGSVDLVAAIGLVDALPPKVVSSIRSRAARTWMTLGPKHFLAEVDRARSAGNFVPDEEIIDLADHAGRMSLSLHEYSTAASLLRLAMDFDTAGDALTMASRMRSLAAALDGLGNVIEARDVLAQVATLGELIGNASLVASAAVQYALPADWYAGDTRASALLDRAASMDLSEDDVTRVLAARAMVEMRIPISPMSDQQLAWISRPQVAHSLADEALQKSTVLSSEVRVLTTLAWRTIHRSPSDLDRRREMARESMNLAQVLRIPSYQVESAVWLSVDAIESSDRHLYDEALSVARWVAERDGNPRLIWRAHTLSCGAAHLEGDLDKAEDYRLRARDVGQSVSTPGWLAADLLLKAEHVISLNDTKVDKEHVLPENFPALINPIGCAAAALIHARVGDPSIAERMVRKALRQLDPESSYLLLATRCADVAIALQNLDLAEQIAAILEPWRGHVAVDSNGWWIDGPVDVWLASLAVLLGKGDMVRKRLTATQSIALSMNDVRSLKRIAGLTQIFESHDPAASSLTNSPDPAVDLTERQRSILRLMSRGLTNREIAQRLSFSISTIRLESMAIYKAIGVNGRTEAVTWFTRSEASSAGIQRG